jgi:hypothetical protein
MWRAKNAPKNSNEILILYHLSAFEAEHKKQAEQAKGSSALPGRPSRG